MYQQLDALQTAVENSQDVPVFGYKSSALLNDEGITGHNEYSDNNVNNIPLSDGTQLSLQEIEKGFRDHISTLSRAFFTHFFGRSSYNVNKMRVLMTAVLGTYKRDYAHNFRAWDSGAVYMSGDVCFLVAYGIRYCFKSLVDDNTSQISANADGSLDYDTDSWSLLNEVRTVQHPIGKPFLWFGGDLPDNYICFSDGQQYRWADYPELNNSDFRVLLTRFTWKGARANDTVFVVPNISELYPISSQQMPEQLSTVQAKVPVHYHNLISGTVSTNSTTNTNHTHPMTTSTNGNHRHYLGDYQSDQYSVEADGKWHEDSKFYGAFEIDRPQDNNYEDYRVLITPKIDAATAAAHSVTAPSRAITHTHSGSVTPSGAGDFTLSDGKYRPGTVKAVLVVRAS